MTTQIKIPTVLRKHTGGESILTAKGKTVDEVLSDIDRNHTGFREKIVDQDGRLHRFINLYVNDEDVRFLEQLDTRIGPSDTIAILPAVAGG